MSIPAHLKTMREITGTHEAAGAGDNPVILSWPRAIAARFPETASYCSNYKHDAIAWCGLTVGYCMAVNGIRPVFEAGDTGKFLWAQAWKHFGHSVDDPEPGDVLVFEHHVTLYERTEGSHYVCRGGNQSDTVKESSYPISSCQAIRRAPAAGAVDAVDAPTARPEIKLGDSGSVVADLQRRLGIAQTGAFDATTDAAVRAYQRQHGLDVDGEVGALTWGSLTGDIPARRFSKITATVFGGRGDQQPAAYSDVAAGWDQRPGVALPYRFKGARPQVRVFKDGRSVVCPIVDVGPWNTNDPYWQGGARPQAESGTDTRGRSTNDAGIDLTPAAARAIGLEGKGVVDWEFVGGEAAAPPMILPPELTPPELTAPDIMQTMQALRALLAPLFKLMEKPMTEPTPIPTPPPPPPPPVSDVRQQQPQLDVEKLSRLIGMGLAVVNALAGRAPLIPTPIAGVTPIAEPVPLSPVDKALGGDALVGKKTPFAILAYAGLSIFQALGIAGTATGVTATPTGQILTTLIGAFGGLGLVAKVDRVIKVVQLATGVLGALRKPPAP